MKKIFCLAIIGLVLGAFGVSEQVMGQFVPAPGDAQTQPIYIVGGTIHVGNGEVIEDGVLAFENGKLSVVNTRSSNIKRGGIKMIDGKVALGETKPVLIPDEGEAEIINAEGKHIYPGFISPNSLMGLLEISALRQTSDYQEVGKYKPHVRTIIAYNTDSWVTPTIRSNGILLAQIRPAGGAIPGTSSVVQLDAWNYEDAVFKEDDAVFVNYPNPVSRGGWWAEPGDIKKNEKYLNQLTELYSFFREAKAYCQLDSHDETNLKFEAMCGVFDKSKKVFVNANHAKTILGAIDLKKEFDIDVVVVGGRDSWLVTDELKENNVPVVLYKTHNLPYRADDDIDLPYKMPAILKEAGVEFCMQAQTSAGEQRNLPFTAGKAVAYGLTKEEALATITSSTAKILGIDDRVGTLEEGKDATLIISTGDALDPKTNHVEIAFIGGRRVNLENKQKELYRKFSDKYGLEKKQH